MDQHLFNGEYYQQHVQYEGLRDTSFAQSVAHVDENSSEMQRLLKREGPKYQYGSGCLSDGVIGAWMANTYGIETPLATGNVQATLQAIFKHNFKTDLSQHANAQRPGYAMGREPGLLLCSWPRGGKPTLPFVYSDEVWTGIEYQVASHLIEEGFVERRADHSRRPFAAATTAARAIHGTNTNAATGMRAPCPAMHLLGAALRIPLFRGPAHPLVRPPHPHAAISMLLFNRLRIRHNRAPRPVDHRPSRRGRATN